MRESINIKDRKYLLAFIINVGVMILLFLLFEPTAKSDDYDMMNVLYGGYNGEYSPFILYSNPIWGYMLCFLLKLVPTLPWFFIVQYVFMLWGMIEITKIFLDRTGISLWMLIPILAWIYYEFFVRITFTKTAGLLTACGYMIIFHVFFGKDRITPEIVKGMVLIIIGALQRAGLYQLVSLIIFGGFIIIILLNRSSINRKLIIKLIIAAIIAAALFVAVDSIRIIGNSLYNTDKVWQDYLSVNNTRVALFDYGIPQYDKYREEYEEINVSYADYQMWFEIYVRDDQEQLTTEKLLDIRAISNHDVELSIFDQILNAMHQIIKWCFGNTMFYLFCGSCILLILSRKNGVVPIILMILAMSFVAYFYLSVKGRTQHHVDAVIFLAASFIILYFCEMPIMEKAANPAAALCIVGLCIISLFGSEISSSSYYGTEYENIDSQEDQYALTKSQLDLLSDDSDHLYLFNAQDTNTIYSAFTVWEVIPPGYYHNIHRLNMDHIPVHKNVLKDFDVENPIREVVNSDVIYYYIGLDNESKAQIVLNYIIDNYNDDARMIRVKSTEQGAVYRFYTDDLKKDLTDLKDPSGLEYDIKADYNRYDGILSVSGFIFENNTDSFAQNVYIHVTNNNTGEDNFYLTEQSKNNKLNNSDKFEGAYSCFEQDIDLSSSAFTEYDVSILLENSNGIYEIPITIRE